ncbi:diacylglycerol kinase [Alisedimentitalea sp. MJ-SS2]|uniref:diacylglycerol kinase n=1 Tax=Aliisedimentitalea sp. MJ-SS2 TaxID=3049795 RepID=UPI00291132C3|nr:diacylglycerol kinase [Alisedimentitalea sp. MJ-SS2]MDU8927315.1 diacylglycerol kinase [Alisedimentitalea sp. MJ-SS2]
MLYFFRRLKDRIIWSSRGVMRTWQSEHSFRSWVWANLVSASLAFVLPISLSERALILSLGVLVMAFELINTAIEHTVDYISEEIHPMAEKAKDAASAGVFLSSLAAGVAWLVVLSQFILP